MEPDDDFEPLMDINALGAPMITIEPIFYPPTLWQEVERILEYNHKAIVLFLLLGFLSFALPLIFPLFFSKSYGVVLVYIMTFSSIIGSIFYSSSVRVSRFR